MKLKEFNGFWSKVSFAKGCWEWTGGKWEGYGKAWISGKHASAHRVSYEQDFGAIPDGFQIDHLCRNPGCVNPAHLEAVTRSENVLRGRNKEAQKARGARVTHCPKGHEYTVENTHYRPNGWRLCRACARVRAKAGRDRKNL